jgi:hypothetical protein
LGSVETRTPFFEMDDDGFKTVPKGALLVFLRKQMSSNRIFYEVLYGDQKGWVVEQQVVVFDGEK